MDVRTYDLLIHFLFYNAAINNIKKTSYPD